MTQIRAVTTIDDSLLAHVRQTLEEAEAAVPGRPITLRWVGP